MASSIAEAISGGAGKSPAERMEAVSIETLPNEILAHIFGYLDTPPPSYNIDVLHDEPAYALTMLEDSPLKASSLVSRLWRDVSRSILFKHAQFVALKQTTRSIELSKQMKPFNDFLATNHLQNVKSLSLIIYDNKVTDNAKGDRKLDDFTDFWNTLFQTIDPMNLLIVASPEALGALTACRVTLTDAWNFDCPCHYLRLQRLPGNSKAQENQKKATKATVVDSHAGSSGTIPSHFEESSVQGQQQNSRAKSSTLFDIRPWDKILLNEGSFIKAYATYEFWLRKAPSILQYLIGAAPQDQACITPRIRDMEYVALFPMSGHFSDLSENLPRLDRLYCQLVPRNDILSDPKKMVQVESEDLWMERNACYASLMRELFNSPPSNNYQHLKVFESGDSADRAAWGMAVEYVKRAGHGWKVSGDGVFIRKPEDIIPSEDEPEGEPSTFHGSLIKWAWNGTSELPVSAYTLYGHPMGP